MKKGCLIGCLTVAGLAVLALVALVIVIDRAFGFLRPAARVDLAAVYGENHPVAIRFDPDMAYMKVLTAEAFNQDPTVLEWLMPHEALVLMDADTETRTRELTLAISTRRFGGLLSWYFPPPGSWEFAKGLMVRDMAFGNNGVFYLRADGEFDEQTLASWEGVDTRETVPAFNFERNHTLEVLINNRAGVAFYALDAFLGNEAETASGQVAPPPDDEPVVSPDYAKGPLLDPDDRTLLANTISVARLTADLVGHDAMEMTWHAICPDAAAAERALPALERFREALIRRLTDEDVSIEGSLRQAGNEIAGTFAVQRFTGPLADRTERFLDDLERRQRQQYR